MPRLTQVLTAEAVQEAEWGAESQSTLWRVPDDLWERVRPILAELDPPKTTGRPRNDARATLDAILFRLRSGVQWNQLPPQFPDDSSVHRAFQRWVEQGVFERIWADLVAACDALGGVDWEWQAVDGAMGKARMGGISAGRTPRTGASRGSSAACRSTVTADRWVWSSREPTGLISRFWPPRSTRVSWSDHGCGGGIRRICASIKATTLMRCGRRWSIGSMSRTSRCGGCPNRCRERIGGRRGGGLWNAHWHGSQSAARSSSGGTQRRPTIVVLGSLPALSSGTADFSA
jgi:transposase